MKVVNNDKIMKEVQRIKLTNKFGLTIVGGKRFFAVLGVIHLTIAWGRPWTW